METCRNLLRSDGGIELGPELCLTIVEALIQIEPRAVRSLMLVSKSCHSLLTAFERSITKTASKNDKMLEYVNSTECTILSSQLPAGNVMVTAHTYSWYWEMQFRSSSLDLLLDHQLTNMDGAESDGWPTLNTSKTQLHQRETRFKKDGFLLLYRLSDCAAGLPDIAEIRSKQSLFLESLSTVALATLGVMVEIIGQGYFNMTKASLKQTNLLNSSVRQASNPDILTDSQPVTPSSAPFNDLMSDNWIRESMCVFEDLVQRYGPYYAWAYVDGEREVIRRADRWARAELQQGLDNMNAFELGYTMSFASLQSIVWRIFCRKQNCTLQGGWNEAKELVEQEMAGYKLTK